MVRRTVSCSGGGGAGTKVVQGWREEQRRGLGGGEHDGYIQAAVTGRAGGEVVARRALKGEVRMVRSFNDSLVCRGVPESLGGPVSLNDRASARNNAR
jgi:hypothetical protein